MRMIFHFKFLSCLVCITGSFLLIQSVCFAANDTTTLQNEIKLSNRVQRLLSGRTEDGRLSPISNPYQKWHGAHWVLVHLAELGYPGDSFLLPLREQVHDLWLCEKMQRLVECKSKSEASRVNGVPVGEIQSSISKASEVFLSRHMFRGKRNGQVVNAEFLKLHYPCYWHYDILFGLKVISECGLIKDPRCEEALNILESKELPDGGWPAEGRYCLS